MKTKVDSIVADLSNSTLKIAPVIDGKIGEVKRFPTQDVTAGALKELTSDWENWDYLALASVVPEKTTFFENVFGDKLRVINHESDLGIEIDFPDPSMVGPDRLVNTVSCVHHYGAPAIVVDFGTAVTFDIISSRPAYIGGVIAPGLDLMRDYLHSKTALLPIIDLEEPPSPIGKTTKEAMLAGSVFGYRGLVKEIIHSIQDELGEEKIHVVATGGYAELIAKGVSEIHDINPLLTLEGIKIVGERNR